MQLECDFGGEKYSLSASKLVAQHGTMNEQLRLTSTGKLFRLRVERGYGPLFLILDPLTRPQAAEWAELAFRTDPTARKRALFRIAQTKDY